MGRLTKDQTAVIENLQTKLAGKDLWIRTSLYGQEEYINITEINAKGEFGFYRLPSYWVGNHYAYNPYTLEKREPEEVSAWLHDTIFHRNLFSPDLRLNITALVKREAITTEALVHLIID